MSLNAYRHRLSAELEAYAAQQIATATASHGQAAGEACRRLFVAVMADNNHWCGLLTLVGYELEQGSRDDMIIQAARAMEVMHASARLFDTGDIEAAQTGLHMSEITLANLDGATESDRLKVLSILNRSSLLRMQGQTAHYEFLNPMHVGMVLAGGDCHATDDITAFALALATDPAEAGRLADGLEDRWRQTGLLRDLAEKHLRSSV